MFVDFMRKHSKNYPYTTAAEVRRLLWEAPLKKSIGPFFEKFPTGPTKTCHSMLIMFYFPNEIKYLGINV